MGIYKDYISEDFVELVDEQIRQSQIYGQDSA